MEDPKIAIAVVVENAGFGSTWAAPIASLMMEKYLTDSLRAERVKEVERIAGSDLMPSWIPRVQYIADSTRAFEWFKMTKDSSYIKKYLRGGSHVVPRDTVKLRTTPPVPRPSQPETPERRVTYLHKMDIIDNKTRTFKIKRSVAA